MSTIFVSGLVLTCCASATNLGGNGLNIDIYDLPNGGTRSCKWRTEKDACPYDFELRVCKENGSMGECYPCDLEAGYRNCLVQVYSDNKDIKCSRPRLDCQPSESLNITNNIDGSCRYHCVCNARKGYIFNGSECVHLKTKCGVNSTIINDKCTGCPSGTYKPEVGFEDCIPIPKEKSVTQTTGSSVTTPSLVRTTAEVQVTTFSDISSGRPPVQTQDDTSDNNIPVIITVVIILIIFLIIIIVIIVCICWKRCQGSGSPSSLSIRFCYFEKMLCCVTPGTRPLDQAEGTGDNVAHDEDIERGSTSTGADEPVSDAGNNETLPPSYRTNATKEKSLEISDTAQHHAIKWCDAEHAEQHQKSPKILHFPIDSTHVPNGFMSNGNSPHEVDESVINKDVHSIPPNAREIHGPVAGPSAEPTETEPFLPDSQNQRDTASHMSSADKFKSFPTLSTKGPSSLQANQQSHAPDSKTSKPMSSASSSWSFPTLDTKGSSSLLANQHSKGDVKTEAAGTVAVGLGGGRKEERKRLLEGEEIAMSELNGHGNYPGEPTDFSFGSKFSVISNCDK